MKAILLLEDGTIFEGGSFGAEGFYCGEVVFNTSMSGYQEILTDPSYNEQIIVMTYPLIGNYGANKDDCESRRVFAGGFIVRENCNYPSSWRSGYSLSKYLKKNNIVALEGIDTRKLVRHIRSFGAMRGVIFSGGYGKTAMAEKLRRYPGLVGRDIVKDVTVSRSYHWKDVSAERAGSERQVGGQKYRVVAYDFGIKHNILRLLSRYGCDVRVVPAQTSARRVLSLRPDGVFLSNGPGDPAAVGYAIENIRQILGKVPLFGICLGHHFSGWRWADRPTS